MTGLRFVAMKKLHQTDVVVSVDVHQAEHLKTLKLKLYRQDEPQRAVHSVKLDQQSPLVVLPPLAMDGTRYTLQLESNLGRNAYDYQTQEAAFAASQPTRHVRLRFHPRRKTLDAETAQVSLRSMAALLVCVLVGYNYDKVLALVAKSTAAVLATSRRKGSAAGGGNPSSGGGGGGGGVSSSSSSQRPVFSQQELDLFQEDSAAASSAAAAAAKKKIKARKV